MAANLSHLKNDTGILSASNATNVNAIWLVKVSSQMELIFFVQNAVDKPRLNLAYTNTQI